jgi:hypothetical protein
MYSLAKWTTSLVMTALLLCPVVSANETTQDFTLLNLSGKTVSSIIINQDAHAFWENHNTLNNNQSVKVAFHGSNCNYDVKVEYLGGGVTWPMVNLCEITSNHTIIIHRDEVGKMHLKYPN